MVLLSTKENSPTAVLEGVDVLLTGGANPAVGDPSGNLPLYEALRNFPKEAEGLGKKLLHASINFGSDTTEDGNDASGTTEESSWWQKWELSFNKMDWSSAKAWLCGPQSALPADLSKQICSIAVCVLAEKHLELSKDDVNSDSATLDERRLYVASILRTCRQFEAVMDRKWFDYLLDLS
jgi:hypothetical protein